MPVLLRASLPWFFALATMVLSWLFPHASATAAPWIFLSSAILLGVPHGACDPWVPGWVLHRPSRLPFLTVFFTSYLALSALYLVLWRIYPFPSTVFFLCLTAWHWGSADGSLEFHPGARWLAFSIARGALVMLAPFAFHPDEAWQVVQRMAPDAPAIPPHYFFLAGLIFGLCLQGISRSSWSAWAETLLLLCLFYLTPPLLSVGVYFITFHAWRHLLRLAALRDQLTTLQNLLWAKSVARLLLLSAPLTVATLIFLPWIPSWANASAKQNWVGPYLVLLAVLTLPHAILVGWVDKKTNIPRV